MQLINSVYFYLSLLINKESVALRPHSYCDFKMSVTICNPQEPYLRYSMQEVKNTQTKVKVCVQELILVACT